VNSGGCESFLDGIFNALAINKCVEELKLVNNTSNGLKLKDSNTLKFIEKNSTLKCLNFSNIQFSEIEMKILNLSLMNNDSLTELDLSYSNFRGPFQFLEKMNLKKFTFLGILESLKLKDNLIYGDFGIKISYNYEQIIGFINHLKSNTSLTNLTLSNGYCKVEYIREFGEMIDYLSSHENIESIFLEEFIEMKEPTDYHQLLKNPKLKNLSLPWSIKSTDAFENLLNALNENENIQNLNISWNNRIDSQFYFEKISNKSLQTINMKGYLNHCLILRQWN
jgi:hypothetical protein